MNGCSLMTNTLLWWIACNNFTTVLLAMPRAKEYHSARGTGEVIDKFGMETNSEPSCEELKAMWRFSKRQSRAAEITNEIPTYRDPFSYNIWDPYFPRSRNGGGGLRTVARSKPRPVYGVMIHKPSSFRVHDVMDRNRAFEDFNRYYGISQPYHLPRRGKTAVRLGGGDVGIPQSGSFQHLKELIRTERARELQEQRLSEEIAAKAANAHREIPIRSHHRDRDRDFQQNLGLTYMMNAENESKHEPKEKPSRYSGVLVFPNILSRNTRDEKGEFISRLGQYEKPMDYYQDSISHRSMYRRNFYTMKRELCCRAKNYFSSA